MNGQKIRVDMYMGHLNNNCKGSEIISSGVNDKNTGGLYTKR